MLPIITSRHWLHLFMEMWTLFIGYWNTKSILIELPRCCKISNIWRWQRAFPMNRLPRISFDFSHFIASWQTNHSQQKQPDTCWHFWIFMRKIFDQFSSNIGFNPVYFESGFNIDLIIRIIRSICAAETFISKLDNGKRVKIANKSRCNLVFMLS